MGTGYSESQKIQYDEEYHFGNTTVYVVAPKITEEEKQKRWRNFCEIASRVAQIMIDRGEVDKLMKKL